MNSVSFSSFFPSLFICTESKFFEEKKDKKRYENNPRLALDFLNFSSFNLYLFVCSFPFFSFTIFLRTSTSSASLVLLFFIWTFLLIDSIFFILSFENNPLEHHQTISKGPYRRSVPRLFLIRVACVIIYAFVACLSFYIFPSFSFSLFLFFSFRLHKRKENYSTFNICLCILTEQ